MLRQLVTLLLLASLGCGQGADGESGGSSRGVRGEHSIAASEILAQFQGAWRLSSEKTLARWEADGAAAKEIEQARELGAIFPLHPNMVVENDVAALAGVVEGEYRFFALHPHDKWVCGKAWHHEDRYDPGDMSKVLVRLEVREADLLLSIRMSDDSLEMDDADLVDMPLTSGSAEDCEADSAPTPPWSPWQTYVFERGGEGDD